VEELAAKLRHVIEHSGMEQVKLEDNKPEMKSGDHKKC
jgi:RecB family endonuclease NucS